MSRRFFSGKSLQAAVLAAAAHYDVDPNELAYKPVEKKKGRLRATAKVVIAVDPDAPVKAGAAESAAPEVERGEDSARQAATRDEDSEPEEEEEEEEDSEDEDEDLDEEDDDEDEVDDDSDVEDEADDEADDDRRTGDEAEDEVDGGDDEVDWYESTAVDEADDPYAFEDDPDGNRLDVPPPHLKSHRRPEDDLPTFGRRRGGRGGGGRGRGGQPPQAGGGQAERPPRGGRRQKTDRSGGRRAQADRKPRGGRRRGGGEEKPTAKDRGREPDRGKVRSPRSGRGKAGLVDLPPAPRPLAERLERAEGELADAARKAVAVIADVTGLELEAEIFEGDDRLEIDLSSPHSELLIAEDGELLVAIEHLLPRVMRGFGDETAAVRVDCENFQEIREEKLRSFAQQVANEVRKSGRARSLTPLSPSDRRIVHIAITTEPGVDSQSDGRGFLKRVRVSPSD